MTIVGDDAVAAVRELYEGGRRRSRAVRPGPLGQALLENGLLDKLRLWTITETGPNGVVGVTYEPEG